MIEKMKERRTIRKYRQEDVPESLVEELLEVAGLQTQETCNYTA